MKSHWIVWLLAVGWLPWSATAAEIKTIWLTHRSNDPSRVVVNWITDGPRDSVVRFGPTSEYGNTVRIDEATTLHHVEIPSTMDGPVCHYSVSSGIHRSADASFKTYPDNVLRVAVAADWQRKADLSAIRADDPHLLMTAGDQIDRLWQQCGEGQRECVTPYITLIDSYPELFRSTPFMPVLGNHDREIRPRGSKPPELPVYDVDATAFRRFFELPDDEWKWHFDVPIFGVRFVGLDFNHISDFGTTWQSCHAFDADSDQFHWYKSLTEQPNPFDVSPFVVTLYNERNASIRYQAGKQWHDLFRRGTCCISGYGYYAERAEFDGFTYYNSSLSGTGNQYPDPHSQLLLGEDSYVLLTIQRNGPMTVELKNPKTGKVLDRKEFPRK